MSERLTALADAGVSIWLDDLSRERIETGNLADLVKNSSVVGVTTNPTIFAAALADGERYDEQVGRLVASDADVDDTIFELTTTDVRDACDVLADACERHRRRRRPGLDRGRARARLRHRRHGEAPRTRCGRRSTGPTCSSRSPPPPRGSRPSPRCSGQGISVNVTLIFGLDRYDQVMEAYLAGLEAARYAGHDLSGIHSVASFFVSRGSARSTASRQAHRRRRRHGPALRPQGQGRRRQRAARLRGLRAEVRRRAVRGPLKADGRQHPASAVGVDRREEPRLPRHPLRLRAGRRQHRQHHAGEDHAGLRRPRRGHRATGATRTTTTPAPSWRRWPRPASTTTTSSRPSSGRASTSS